MVGLLSDIEAAVLMVIGRPLELLRISHGPLRKGQVLVQLAWSGVCRSQLLEVNGLRGPDRFLPHALGHEGAGTVLATGPGVTKVRSGDRVVVTWIKGAGLESGGTTYSAGDGRTVNSGPVSTFMQRAVVSENRVVPIDREMPLREAALLGCAVPTGAGVVLNTAKVTEGKSVAIFGVGGVGLSAVIGAKLAKASPIIAIDVSLPRLEMAQTLGATHTVDTSHQDAVAEVSRISGGKGTDFAVEAAGRRETMEAAFASVRDGGGLCVIAGNAPVGTHIEIDPMSLIRGKRIVGTWGGETDPDRDIPMYARRFLAGEAPLSELITHTYALADVNQALTDLDAGKVGRAMLDLSGEAL